MEKIIKRIATAIVLIIGGMFVLRCCMVADKTVLKNLAPTDAIASLYSADASIDVKTVKVEQEIAEDGYFSAYAFYYIPEASEAQLTVRWNDSVYKYTDMEKGAEFSFYLLNESTGEKYPMETIQSKKRSIYNYRKLVADGVVIGDSDTITVVMELRDGFESTHYVRHAEQPLKDYKLTGGDKRRLGGK